MFCWFFFSWFLPNNLHTPYRDCSICVAWSPVHTERTNIYDSIMSYYSLCHPVITFHYLLTSSNCSPVYCKFWCLIFCFSFLQFQIIPLEPNRFMFWILVYTLLYTFQVHLILLLLAPKVWSSLAVTHLFSPSISSPPTNWSK